MANVPLSTDVPKIYVPSLSVPKISAPKIYVPHIQVPGAGTINKKRYRTASNFADILLGNPITGTRQLQDTLEKAGLEDWKYIPLLNRIIGAGVMVKEKTIDPLIQGDIDTALINTLQNIGESLDIAANPVKSLMPAAGGGTFEDFLKSMGWLDGAYRELYQYDTGSFILDLTLEVLSDPLTYVSYGAGKAMQTSVNTAADFITEAFEQTAKNSSKILGNIDPKIYNNILEKHIKELGSNPSKFLNEVLSELNIKQNSLLKTLDGLDVNSTTYKAVKKLITEIDNYKPLLTKTDLADNIMKIRFTEGYNQYFKALRIANIDKGILYASSTLTPLAGAGILAFNKIARPAFRALWNSVIRKMDTYKLEDFLNNPKRIMKELNNEARLRSGVIDDLFNKYKPTANKTVKEILENYKINKDAVINKWLEMYYEMGSQFSIDALNNKFKRWFTKFIVELDETADITIEDIVGTDALRTSKVGQILNASSKVVDDITEQVSDIGTVIVGSAELVNNKFKRIIENQMADFFTSKGIPTADTSLDAYSDIRRLIFLKESLFNGDMSAAKLKELLERAAGTDALYRIQMLLNYAGLNEDNIDYINLLMNSIKIQGPKSDLINLIKENLLDTRLDTYSSVTNLSVKGSTTQTIDLLKYAGSKVDYNNLDSDLTGLLNENLYKTINNLVNVEFKDSIDSIKKLQTELTDKVFEMFNDIKQLKDSPNIFSDYAGNNNDVELLTTILEYDIDSIKNISDLEAFNNTLGELKQRSKSWAMQALDFIKKPEAITTDTLIAKDPNFFIELNLILNPDWMTSHIKDPYYFVQDVINSNQKIVGMTLSTHGRFIEVHRALASSPNSEYFNQLIRPNSKIRKALSNVIKTLYNSGNPIDINNANKLKSLLSTFDSDANLITLLQKAANMADALPYEQEVRDYIENLVFEKLIWFGEIYENTTQATEYLDKLVNEYMVQLRKDLEPLNIFQQNNNLDDLAEELQDLKYKLKKGVSLTEQEYNRYEELLSISSTISERPRDLDTIRDAVRGMYKTYLYKQNKLNTTYNLVIPTVNYIGASKNNVLGLLDDLGLSTDTILKSLAEANYTVEELTDIGSFLTKTTNIQAKNLTEQSTNYISNALNNIGNIVSEIPNSKTVVKTAIGADSYQKAIDKMLQEVAQNSLRSTISSAYKDIQRIITDTRGTNTILGRIYGTSWGRPGNLYNIVSYTTTDKFNKYVMQNTIFNNSYAWSVANGYYGTSTLFDPYYAAQHHISLEDTLVNSRTMTTEQSVEYYKFYRNYKQMYEVVSNRGAIKKEEYLDRTAQLLAYVYDNSTVAYRPRDPYTYFSSLSSEDLLTWHAITKNRGINKVLAERYINAYDAYKAEAFNNTSNYLKDTLENIDIYEEANDVMLHSIKLDTNYIEDAMSRVAAQHLAAIDTTVATDLKRYLKDTSTLTRHKAILDEYIDKDVFAYNNVKKLIHKLDPLNKNHLTWQEDIILKDLTSNNLKRSLQESPELINYYLTHNTYGEMFMVLDNAKDKFMFTKEQMNAAKINIVKLPKTDNIYYIYKTGDLKKKFTPKWYKSTGEYSDIQKELADYFKELSPYYRFNDIDLPFEVYNGELISKENWEIIKSSKRLKKLLIRNPYQKSYLDTSNNFWEKGFFRPNTLIVGNADAYNQLMEYTTDAFEKAGVDKVYKPKGLLRSAAVSGTTVIKNANNKNHYLAIMFNDEFAIDGPIFKDILDNASVEDLQELLKRNNYDVAVLRADKNGNPRVYRLIIDSKEALEEAHKEAAVILPHEVYRNAVLVLERDININPLLRIYKGLVTLTYKTFMLFSVGTLLRNGLDSAIYKNAATTDGFNSIIDNFKYEHKAAKMLDWYDKVRMRMVDLARQADKEAPGIDEIKAILNTLSKEEQSVYKLVDLYINSGASGGFTKEFQEFLVEYNLSKGVTKEFPFETAWKNLIANIPPVALTRNLNDTFEQSSRLGLLLNLIDHGEEFTTAIRKVINTHFDYSFRVRGAELLEQVFWFSTFPINNFLYYINDGLTRNPLLIKTYMDAIELSWNASDITWDDIRNSDYLKYNVLAGNLRFDTTLFGNIVFKLSPSAFDFFNLAANPGGEVLDRLNPFFSTLLDPSQVETLNPLYTPMYRAQQILEGKSYVPSVYSEIYTYNKNKKHYIEWEPYVAKTWRRYPKRSYFKKPDNMARMRYRFATSRYYFNKGKNYNLWLNSTTAIEPYWYMYRFNKAQGRYTRAMKKVNMPAGYDL